MVPSGLCEPGVVPSSRESHGLELEVWGWAREKKQVNSIFIHLYAPASPKW
jgi:hypothetical protein